MSQNNANTNLSDNPVESKYLVVPLSYCYLDAFIRLYQKVFRESPVYQEVFTAEKIWQSTRTMDIFILLDSVENEVIGFIGGEPFKERHEDDLDDVVFNNLKNPGNTYYVAELGIRSELQGFGLGKLLFKHLIDWIPTRFQELVLHTVLDNPAQHLYKKFGFSEMKYPDGGTISSQFEYETIDGTVVKPGLYYYRNLALK